VGSRVFLFTKWRTNCATAQKGLKSLVPSQQLQLLDCAILRSARYFAFLRRPSKRLIVSRLTFTP
jgi:hypothetical protein